MVRVSPLQSTPPCSWLTVVTNTGVAAASGAVRRRGGALARCPDLSCTPLFLASAGQRQRVLQVDLGLHHVCVPRAVHGESCKPQLPVVVERAAALLGGIFRQHAQPGQVRFPGSPLQTEAARSPPKSWTLAPLQITALLAWRQFGWRLYGKLGVDFREKGAATRMRKALQRNAFITVLKINVMFLVRMLCAGKAGCCWVLRCAMCRLRTRPWWTACPWSAALE